MAQFGLALADLQLISTPLFILVIVLRHTKTKTKSGLAKTAYFGITTNFLSMALKVKFLPDRAGVGRKTCVGIFLQPVDINWSIILLWETTALKAGGGLSDRCVTPNMEILFLLQPHK